MKKMLKKILKLIIESIDPYLLLKIKKNINVIRRMDYHRYDIFLNIDSEIEYETRLHSCKKEPDTIKWIETFIKEGDVVYDIGANVGVYSFVISKFTHGKVKVYAFEPSFVTFVQLCRNVLLNNCEESIVPLLLPLSDEIKLDYFNHHDLSPGGSLHTFGKNVDYKNQVFVPLYKQQMISYSIDGLIKQFQLEVPNHIKLDVDGTEFLILMGGTETLSNKLVKSILVEVNEELEETKNLVPFLNEKGFRIYSKSAADLTGSIPNSYNYIFKRNL